MDYLKIRSQIISFGGWRHWKWAAKIWLKQQQGKLSLFLCLGRSNWISESEIEEAVQSYNTVVISIFPGHHRITTTKSCGSIHRYYFNLGSYYNFKEFLNAFSELQIACNWTRRGKSSKKLCLTLKLDTAYVEV